MLEDIILQLNLPRKEAEMVRKEIDNPTCTNKLVLFIRQKINRQLAFQRTQGLFRLMGL